MATFLENQAIDRGKEGKDTLTHEADFPIGLRSVSLKVSRSCSSCTDRREGLNPFSFAPISFAINNTNASFGGMFSDAQ